MKNFKEITPIPYTLEEDLELIKTENFTNKKLIEKYSFYPTLILMDYQFEYFYFRDSVIEKITTELLQYAKYYHEYSTELNESLYQKLQKFTEELMVKYIVEEKARKI